MFFKSLTFEDCFGLLPRCVLLGLMKIGASQALLRGKELLLQWTCFPCSARTQGTPTPAPNTHTPASLGSFLFQLPGLASVWCVPAGVYHSWHFSPSVCLSIASAYLSSRRFFWSDLRRAGDLWWRLLSLCVEAASWAYCLAVRGRAERFPE